MLVNKLSYILLRKVTPYELPVYNVLIRCAVFFVFAVVLYYQQCAPDLDSIVIDRINVFTMEDCLKPERGDLYMTAVFCKGIVKLTKAPDNNLFSAFTGCLYARKTRALMWFLLFVFLAFLFLLPPVPLVVAIGGVGALFFTITQVLPLSSTNCYSNRRMIMYLPTITTVFLAAFLNQKDRIMYWLHILGLGFIISYYPFLRQEVQGMTTLMFLTVMAFSCFLLFHSFSYKGGLHKKVFVSLAKKLSVIIVILICMNFFIKNAIKFYVFQKTNESFFSAEVPSHGAFHPLYASLCYVANPYFITPTDFSGNLQTLYMRNSGEEDLYLKGTAANDSYQSIIGKIYIATVIESPDVFLKNIFVKLSIFHNYMLGKNDSRYSLVDVMGTFNNKYLVWMYTVFLVVFPIMLFLVFFVYRSERLVLLTIGFSAMAAAALAVRILTFPGYISSANGLLIAAFFVFIPAIVVYSREKYRSFYASNDKEFFRKIYKVLKFLAFATVAFCIVATAWTFYRNHINSTAAMKLLQGDPLPVIQNMQHRYAYLFNRLSSAEKLQIAAKLKAMEGNGVVGRIVSTTGDTALFNVLAALYSEKEMHIIGYYGKSQTITNDFRYGFLDYLSISRHETIGLTMSNFGGDMCLAGINDKNRDECIGIGVHSGFFNNEYVMISLPVTESFKKNRQLYIKLLPREGKDLYGKEDITIYGEPVSTIVVDFNPQGK